MSKMADKGFYKEFTRTEEEKLMIKLLRKVEDLEKEVSELKGEVNTLKNKLKGE